jgi:pyridoxal phosphate enzyme (YggS family)
VKNPLEHNINIIKERIATARDKYNYTHEVKLIAVTKTKPVELIAEAYELGLRDFGENKVQEALQKTASLNHTDINWHLIGHLQTNKAKQAVSFASLIHSVDSLRLAEEIQKHAANSGKVQNILVQVNTSNEDSKSGCEPNDAIELIKKVTDLPNVRINGLMTIGKLTDNKDEIRDCFKLLKSLFEEAKQLNHQHIDIKHLSMGMSDDFELAIEEGSNMVRVGSAIFGQRL